MIDIALLHSRIAGSALDFLRELFGEEVKPAGPERWRVGRHGSLAIALKEGRLVFFSHEDGEGGDAVGLWQRVRGGSAGEAIRAVGAWARVPDGGMQMGRGGDTERGRRGDVQSGRGGDKETGSWGDLHPPRPRHFSPSPCLPLSPSPEQYQEAFALARRLAGDEGLCARIARKRGWRAETIRELAAQEALGWSDGWAGRHTGALAFCYSSGIKQRWKRRDGERMIRWSCGRPASLWREWTVLDQTREVFLMEGETDAISMIDGGAEASIEVAVLALPNAGVVPASLAEVARGRKVVLFLDNDEAGQKASRKIEALLRPVAAKVETWRAQ